MPAPSSLIDVISDARWQPETVDAIILAIRPVAR